LLVSFEDKRFDSIPVVGRNCLMIGTWHFRHHARFYLAAVGGVVVWLAALPLARPLPPLIGGDAFFCIYLALMTLLAVRITPEGLRARASEADEGILLIVVLALAAVAFSLGSIFVLLNRAAGPGAAELGLVIATVPLGWLMVHTIAAFHYAHVYYLASDPAASSDERSAVRESGSLQFPGTREPGAWDFLYFSFVIGMTAQVSDVAVLTTGMRRLTLAHGVLSFFYNTVLLALAVNVAVTLAR
jgi:uncharacterized membrane protein